MPENPLWPHDDGHQKGANLDTSQITSMPLKISPFVGLIFAHIHYSLWNITHFCILNIPIQMLLIWGIVLAKGMLLRIGKGSLLGACLPWRKLWFQICFDFIFIIQDVWAQNFCGEGPISMANPSHSKLGEPKRTNPRLRNFACM